MKIRHIIFDFDGTLIDSASSILLSIAHILHQNNIKLKVKLSTELIGPPLMNTLELITGIRDADLLETIASKFKIHYDNYGYKQTREYPNITHTLATLNAREILLYVATNKRDYPTKKIISMFGWSPFFSDLYSLDTVIPPFLSKSNLVAYLIDKHSIDPVTAVYIGDHKTDLKVAKDNRLKFAAAGWGYGSWLESECELLIETPEAMTNIFFR